MKRYFLLTLPLFFLLFIAGPSSAGATSLQDTQQFRALDNFVFSLEERKDSLASIEDKEIYREQLLLRRDVALERLGNLRDARVIKAKKNYQRAKKKAYNSLVRESAKKRAKAKSSYNALVGEAKRDYRNTLTSINDRYGKEIKKLKGQIAGLRKKLKKTKDPSKRVDIGNTINSLQGALKPLTDASARAVSSAKKNLAKRTSQAKKSYENTLKDIRADFTRSWTAAKKKTLADYKRNRNNIASKVKRERGSVFGLTEQGMSYIRQMPEPQEKAKKKKNSKKSKKG